MVKRQEQKKACCCCCGLWALGSIFFGALGLASLVEGIILQVKLDFKYGFLAYVLAFVFLFAAKMCKYRMFSDHPSFSHMAALSPKAKR